MPHPSPGDGTYTELRTGFEIPFRIRGKTKSIPLKMVFGAPKGAYGQLLGIGMEMGKNRQLYRMDLHEWHKHRGVAGSGVRSDEIDAWPDSQDRRFHYHVMHWTGR